jgi:hypothetical protein
MGYKAVRCSAASRWTRSTLGLASLVFSLPYSSMSICGQTGTDFARVGFSNAGCGSGASEAVCAMPKTLNGVVQLVSLIPSELCYASQGCASAYSAVYRCVGSACIKSSRNLITNVGTW